MTDEMDRRLYGGTMEELGAPLGGLRSAFRPTGMPVRLGGNDPLATTFDTSSLDVYGLNGIRRIPVDMASGKTVLKDLLGYGLGWGPDDTLDPAMAGQRIKSFLDAQKGINDPNAPDISPITAVQLAKQKLEESRRQLMGHVEGGPAPVEGIPEGQQSLFMDRMFPKPVPAKTATYADVPDAQKMFTAAYGLMQLLRGEPIGNLAPVFNLPLVQAQKRMDMERQEQVQNLAMDADRARAEFTLASQDVQRRRDDALRSYTMKAKTLEDQYNEAEKVFNEITKTNMRSWAAEDRDIFKKVFDSATDNTERMGAVDALYDRGRISDEEYPRYMAIASVKSSRQIANEELAKQRSTASEFNEAKTDALPEGLKLKWAELDRKKDRDAEEVKIARQRLRIMDDRNNITLSLGAMRDATTNRRITLQAPLWDAQIANYLSQAETRGDASLRGLVGVYSTRLKDVKSEVGRVEDDLAKVLKAMTSKDVRKSPAARAQMQSLADTFGNRLDELRSRQSVFESEYNDLVRDLAAESLPGGGAGAGGAAAGAKAGKSGTRADRNRNPLNIKASAATKRYAGVVGVEGKPAADGGNFLIFDSPASGFAAAKTLLKTKNYRNLTLDAALRRWSNNGYGAAVAKLAGLSGARLVSSLSDGELDRLVKAMARREGYSG